MPLEKSSSNEARQRNIKREIDAGKDPKQAVAIGYSVQREAKKVSDPVVRPDRPAVRNTKVSDSVPAMGDDGGDDEHKSFFQHVKSFFKRGAQGDTSDIVKKGGPGGQLREKNAMDAVDRAVTGAKDDEY